MFMISRAKITQSGVGYAMFDICHLLNLANSRAGKVEPIFMETPGPHPAADEHVAREIDTDDLV
jgi:hypothetical protein